MPLSGWNRARQIGRGRIGLADGEVALVAAALSAKALAGRQYTQIEGRVLFLSRVLEIHADAMGACRHGERHLEIGFVLRPRNVAGENHVWRRLLLSPAQRREDQQQKTDGFCPSV